MNLSDSNMKSVPMIRPKYIFLAGWFLTSIFILLNCHYDLNALDLTGVASIQQRLISASEVHKHQKPLRKIIMIVTFMRSGSSFLGEFFNLHPGKYSSCVHRPKYFMILIKLEAAQWKTISRLFLPIRTNASVWKQLCWK